MNYTKVNDRLIAAISRMELIQTNFSFPFAWITIISPNLKHLDKQNNAKYILFMNFDDIDTVSFSNMKIINRKLFTNKDAEEIVNFVNSLPENIPIIINCLGGISRSTAVAAAITYCLDGDDSIFWEKTCPNKLVFQTLCKAFGKEIPERSWSGIGDNFITLYENDIYE